MINFNLVEPCLMGQNGVMQIDEIIDSGLSKRSQEGYNMTSSATQHSP